jgi:hypothetical protein
MNFATGVNCYSTNSPLPTFILLGHAVQDMFHRPGPADCGIIKISGKWPRSIALRVSMFIGLRLRCVVEKSGFVPC